MLSCYLLWGRPQRNYANPDQSMFCIRDLTKRGLGEVDQAFKSLGRAPVVHYTNDRTAVLKVGHPKPRSEGKHPRGAGLLGMIKDRAACCSLFDTAIRAAIPGGGAVKSRFRHGRGKPFHRDGDSRKNSLGRHDKILGKRDRLGIHERNNGKHQNDEEFMKATLHENPLPGNPTSLIRIDLKLSNVRDCGFARRALCGSAARCGERHLISQVLPLQKS